MDQPSIAMSLLQAFCRDRIVVVVEEPEHFDECPLVRGHSFIRGQFEIIFRRRFGDFAEPGHIVDGFRFLKPACQF